MKKAQLCVIVNRDLAWRGAGRASDYFCSEPSHRKSRKQTWPESDPEAVASDPEPVPDHDVWASESTTEYATDTTGTRASRLLGG
jgi:hypothetical protein